MTKEEKRAKHRQWIKKYRTTEKGKKQRYLRRKAYYDRTNGIGERRKWTSEEEELLFTFEGSDYELALQIKRSIAAIHKRRYLIRRAGGR